MSTVKVYEILDKTFLFDPSSLKFVKLSDEDAGRIKAMPNEERETYLETLKADNPLPTPSRKDYDHSRCDRVMLIFSQGCNMACKYCYEDFSNGFKTDLNMSLEEAKKVY